MKDPIKITQEEIKSISDLNNKYQQSVIDFGNLYVEKMQVDALIKAITDKENELQDKWRELQNQENDLVQSFYKKYGEGSLDVKKALFIPNT